MNSRICPWVLKKQLSFYNPPGRQIYNIDPWYLKRPFLQIEGSYLQNTSLWLWTPATTGLKENTWKSLLWLVRAAGLILLQTNVSLGAWASMGKRDTLWYYSLKMYWSHSESWDHSKGNYLLFSKSTQEPFLGWIVSPDFQMWSLSTSECDCSWGWAPQVDN